jgi:hypothetical protein
MARPVTRSSLTREHGWITGPSMRARLPSLIPLRLITPHVRRAVLAGRRRKRHSVRAAILFVDVRMRAAVASTAASAFLKAGSGPGT